MNTVLLTGRTFYHAEQRQRRRDRPGYDISAAMRPLRPLALSFSAVYYRRDAMKALSQDEILNFPARIQNAKIDVGTNGRFAWTAREPRLHIASEADGALFVENRNDGEQDHRDESAG